MGHLAPAPDHHQGDEVAKSIVRYACFNANKAETMTSNDTRHVLLVCCRNPIPATDEGRRVHEFAWKKHVFGSSFFGWVTKMSHRCSRQSQKRPILKEALAGWRNGDAVHARHFLLATPSQALEQQTSGAAEETGAVAERET